MKPDPKAVVAIEDWPGLLSNSGPSAAGSPPGTAQTQENLQVSRRGELNSRPGYRVVVFEDDE